MKARVDTFNQVNALSVIVKSSRTFVWSSTVNTTVTWPRSPVCRGHSSTAGRGTVAGCAEAAAEDGDGGPGPTSRTRHPGPGSRIPRSRAMHRGRAPSSQQSASHDHMQSAPSLCCLCFVTSHKLESLHHCCTLMHENSEINTLHYWSSKVDCGAYQWENLLQIKCLKIKANNDAGGPFTVIGESQALRPTCRPQQTEQERQWILSPASAFKSHFYFSMSH